MLDAIKSLKLNALRPRGDGEGGNNWEREGTFKKESREGI